MLLAFDVEYLCTLIHELWNVFDISVITSKRYPIELFL
jgi:hypothetical protein